MDKIINKKQQKKQKMILGVGSNTMSESTKLSPRKKAIHILRQSTSEKAFKSIKLADI